MVDYIVFLADDPCELPCFVTDDFSVCASWLQCSLKTLNAHLNGYKQSINGYKVEEVDNTVLWL